MERNRRAFALIRIVGQTIPSFSEPAWPRQRAPDTQEIFDGRIHKAFTALSLSEKLTELIPLQLIWHKPPFTSILIEHCSTNLFPLWAKALIMLLLLRILTIIGYWNTSHILVRKSKGFCAELYVHSCLSEPSDIRHFWVQYTSEAAEPAPELEEAGQFARAFSLRVLGSLTCLMYADVPVVQEEMKDILSVKRWTGWRERWPVGRCAAGNRGRVASNVKQKLCQCHGNFRGPPD